PDVFDTLIRLLNAGVHPIVPQGGSVGASDLTQMAAVGLVLTGRGEAIYHGEVMPAAAALEKAGIECCRLRPKDGLALISANGMAIRTGALGVVDMERLSRLADEIGCLLLEAIGGNFVPRPAEGTGSKPFDGHLAEGQQIGR